MIEVTKELIAIVMAAVLVNNYVLARSEERRVGKECRL